MTQENEKMIKYIIDENNEYESKYNLIELKSLIIELEKLVKCKIYNVDNLIKEINEKSINNKSISLIKEIILKNMIMEIDYNEIFKSKFELSLIFNKNEILILYKNTLLDLEKINIKEELLKNNLDNLPKYPKLYLETLLNILNKLKLKDLSVIYNCINIPVPLWKLYEIKCRKINKDLSHINPELEKIKNGDIYKTITLDISENENKKEKKEIKEIKKDEKDEIYRMEILSYLNDQEVNFFLENINIIDDLYRNSNINDNSYALSGCLTYLEILGKTSNLIIRSYLVNGLITFIMLNDEYINKNKNLKNQFINKIKEIRQSTALLKLTELQFYKEISKTLLKAENFINNNFSNKNLKTEEIPKVPNVPKVLKTSKVDQYGDSDFDSDFDSVD